jgi:predicted component of type VI protein secretion system
MSAVMRLTCLNGKLKGRHWEIHSYARVGRDDHLELIVPDSSVSRVHAAIDNEIGWRVTDLQSRNGTYLNGIRLGVKQGSGSRVDSILLQDRDIIHFGKVGLMVEVRETAGISSSDPSSGFDRKRKERQSDSAILSVSPTALTPGHPTTPEEKWFGARSRHPGMLALIRVGDHYETFYDDAERMVLICDLSPHNGKAKRCRIPAGKLEECLEKLMRQDLRMVVCDRYAEIRVGFPQECLAPVEIGLA